MTRSSALRSSKGTPVNSHHLPNEAVGNPLNDLHRLLLQYQSSIVASVQSITIFLVKADNEALLPVSWNLPISRDKASSTMMKSSGLSTGLWCTLTFASNSSLRPLPTRTQLRKFSYIPLTVNKFHNLFLNTKLSQCASDHFLRNSVKCLL